MSTSQTLLWLQEKLWRLRSKRAWVREQLRALRGFPDHASASYEEPWDEAFGEKLSPLHDGATWCLREHEFFLRILQDLPDNLRVIIACADMVQAMGGVLNLHAADDPMERSTPGADWDAGSELHEGMLFEVEGDASFADAAEAVRVDNMVRMDTSPQHNGELSHGDDGPFSHLKRTASFLAASKKQPATVVKCAQVRSWLHVMVASFEGGF